MATVRLHQEEGKKRRSAKKKEKGEEKRVGSV